MLDLKFIRENPDVVRKAIELKNLSLNLQELLDWDQKVLDIKKQVEALLSERNKNAKMVASAKPEERAALIEKGKKLGEEIEALKPEQKEAEDALQKLLWEVPNIPASDAPVGKDDSDNVVVRSWGKIADKGFTLLSHIDILKKRNWANLDEIGKVCGSRSYSLKNEMVLLEWAILRFALETLLQEGFELMTLPSLVREFTLYNTGHFPQGKDQVYYLSEDDLYLAGTAEVPINSLHSGEILEEALLPRTYGGYSPCFRREAGSAGKDVKGLIRVHQFTKVEQYIICKNDPEESRRWQQKLLKISEGIMQALEIPYRVVECCTGDMGIGKVKMFDIEGWVPSENKYRETHSCSALHDWQARRAQLRYRDTSGKVQYCYTLNNTAIACPRILVPFLENHQMPDATIYIPEKLRPFLSGKSSL